MKVSGGSESKLIGLGHKSLSSFPYLATNSLDEARLLISKQFRDHRLENYRQVSPVQVTQNSVLLERSSFHYLDYGAAVRVRADALAEFYLVLMPVSGKAQLRCGAETAVCTPNSAVIIPCDVAFEVLWDTDCRAIIARIERSAIEDALGSRLGMVIKRPVKFTLGVPTNVGSGAFFRQFVMTSVEQIDADRTLLENRILGSEIGAMLARCMLGTIPHNYSHLVIQSGARPAARCVQNVIAYVDAHAHDPLPLDKLAIVSGVSGRGLQTAFRRHNGMSPTEYVRLVRLQRARAELLSADPWAGLTVTEVALKWGFSHFGRFSAYYHSVFGELPSETLRR